jgi:hypothetical protein
LKASRVRPQDRIPAVFGPERGDGRLEAGDFALETNGFEANSILFIIVAVGLPGALNVDG